MAQSKEAEPVFAYAQINAKIMPMDRGEQFEDPLMEEFEKNGYGAVTGGGTQLGNQNEIAYCGIDIDLFDLEKGVPFVCQFLSERGAPKGSKLSYEADGMKMEVPFGSIEGLAVYLNGTELPDEVYQQCDVNHVVDEINRLLSGKGAMFSHWQGPSETALYLYGDSADEMRHLISGFLAEYPLCQKSRVVRIA
ncbi:MAG TPA: hypothetical protein VKS79_15560 [Gemmataceae bacterium]|nr:hypothetical protein [Gemmataceae bacterium]